MSDQLLTHKYFKLYANCIPVKGASRSIICDVQRGRYNFITNDLYKILCEQNTLVLGDIYDFYGTDNKEVLEEYFDFLLTEEYIFFCDFDELALFPDLDLSWDHPSVITNAIVDVNIHSTHNFAEIFKQLACLGCKAIQLRFFDEISFAEVSRILRLLDVSSVTSIELIMPYPQQCPKHTDIIFFANSHLRLGLVIFHSAPNTTFVIDQALISTRVIITEEKITDESHCGSISKKYFSISIDTFTEAQLHNSCLNRKISIDTTGDIKNCPSMSVSYGSINAITLAEVSKMESFKKLGSINKNQIDICKDCEFRFICTDCRAFRETDDIFAKPAKCNYNPYTETWGDT